MICLVNLLFVYLWVVDFLCKEIVVWGGEVGCGWELDFSSECWLLWDFVGKILWEKDEFRKLFFGW